MKRLFIFEVQHLFWLSPIMSLAGVHNYSYNDCIAS